MIEFLKKFRMILMDKGTNVVYRVKDLIGYDYTDIYTLIMVKQQVFEDGIPIYYYDEDGNEITLNTGKTYIALVAPDVWDDLVVE